MSTGQSGMAATRGNGNVDDKLLEEVADDTVVVCDSSCLIQWLPAMVQVMNGALLQQSFVVEFTIHNQMCDDCHRVEAKDYWRSCVQLRQKVCTNARY